MRRLICSVFLLVTGLIFTPSTQAYRCYGAQADKIPDRFFRIEFTDTKQNKVSPDTVKSLCIKHADWNTQSGLKTLARFIYAVGQGEMSESNILDTLTRNTPTERNKIYRLNTVTLTWKHCSHENGLTRCW